VLLQGTNCGQHTTRIQLLQFATANNVLWVYTFVIVFLYGHSNVFWIWAPVWKQATYIWQWLTPKG
jgi:hypothetical protein